MQNALILTPNELDQLKADILAHLTKEVGKLKETMVEKPIDVFQASEHLSLNPQTLRKKIKAGEPIPHYKLGDREYRFFPSELNAYLKTKCKKR